jgi:hypothetical protein
VTLVTRELFLAPSRSPLSSVSRARISGAALVKLLDQVKIVLCFPLRVHDCSGSDATIAPQGHTIGQPGNLYVGRFSRQLFVVDGQFKRILVFPPIFSLDFLFFFVVCLVHDVLFQTCNASVKTHHVSLCLVWFFCFMRFGKW